MGSVGTDIECGVQLEHEARRPGRSTEGVLAGTFRRLRRNRAATGGLVLLALLLATAIAAPVIAPYDPIKVVPSESLKAPSTRHWLGTDQFGRDILSRLVWGARISLSAGLISVGISAAIGVAVGLVAGFYGGWVDGIVSRVVDMMLAFPGILLALCISAALGPGITQVMIAVGIAGIPTFVRMVRASVLSARENLYVDAARSLGASNPRIIVPHILPNVAAPVIVLATLGLAWSILNAAALSFLGLGAQPPMPEWGAMLSTGREYLRAGWWITTFPGIAIMVAVLSINLVGDGLRDAMDPRLRS
jgi:peptide/nickel transport system permease protein